MKLAGLFVIGVLLILAGMEGNLGSMIGSIIDPANMVASGGSTSPTTSVPPLTSLIGGVNPGG